jgi:predicted CxxxxCH...CXXCH cytochrome family protein
MRPWFYLLLGALLAAGCSSTGTTEQALISHIDAQGKSVPGWVAPFPGPSLHSKSATEDFINNGTSNCTECHGADLTGGISKVSCFISSCHHNQQVTNWSDPAVHGASAKRAPGSSSFYSCQICHAKDFSGGGTGFACAACHGFAPHPSAPWRAALPALTHTNTDQANAPVCAGCHFPDSPNNPPNHPLTPAPAGTPPGCFNSTMCPGTSNHPVPFVDTNHVQATQATFNADCSSCHAITGASPFAAAPACQVCHTAGSPLTLTACTSCHAIPPAGVAYPDISGAHAAHLALNNGAGTPVTCDTCHNGLGSNTLNHYNRANGRPGAGGRVPPGDAAFPATYNAQSGATAFDNVALSCSNVSCHGGVARTQGTPGIPLNWQTDTLDVNTQCTSCHATGAPQFNSNNSGQHAQVAHVAVGCLFCHNTTTLEVNHFTALSTPAMEGPASATIGGAGTSITLYVPGATPGTGTCTALCHPGETRVW